MIRIDNARVENNEHAVKRLQSHVRIITFVHLLKYHIKKVHCSSRHQYIDIFPFYPDGHRHEVSAVCSSLGA